jgi:hypothetical protein
MHWVIAESSYCSSPSRKTGSNFSFLGGQTFFLFVAASTLARYDVDLLLQYVHIV